MSKEMDNNSETTNAKRDYHQEAREARAKVDQWLSEHGITAKVQFIGDDCPMFCEDKGKEGIGTFPRKTHVHGQHYRLELFRSYWKPGPLPEGQTKTRTERLVVDFWNSYHDVELVTIGNKAYRNGDSIFKLGIGGKKPVVTPADVLSCVEFSAPGTFEDWCGEFGYDSDSRKAEGIYRAVQEQARDIGRMFTEEEIEKLWELVREV